MGGNGRMAVPFLFKCNIMLQLLLFEVLITKDDLRDSNNFNYSS